MYRHILLVLVVWNMTSKVQGLISNFLNAIDKQSVSQSTARSFKTDLRQLPAFMKVKRRQQLANLSRDDLVEYILRGGVGDSAISRRIWSLNKFFDYLVDNKLMKKNPLGDITAAELSGNKERNKKLYDMLPLSDMKVLLAFGKEKLLGGDPLPLLLVTCLLSGLKPNEISSLVWNQVVLENDKAHFQIDQRSIPISNYVSLVDFFEAFSFAKMYVRRETVFGFGSGQVWYWMRKYSEETGLNLKASQFRWRYLADLASSGRSIEEIALLTGTTAEYIEKFYDELVQMSQNSL